MIILRSTNRKKGVKNVCPKKRKKKRRKTARDIAPSQFSSSVLIQQALKKSI